MRHYVATFLPRDSINLIEIGKNLQQLWSVGEFKQAEIVCQRQYEFIRKIEKKLPPNIRYHKGDALYNWGISLVGQADREAEFIGVSKFILAYIEDLFDHDTFEFANILPAARIVKAHYSELSSYLAEIQGIVDTRIQNEIIPKDPFDIIRFIGDEALENLRSLFTFRPVDKATEGETAKSKVFIVHGRNLKAKEAMDAFLESLGLEILSWMDLLKETGNPNAYLYEIVRKGFDLAQAVVVLMTPDDRGRLRNELCEKEEEEEEKKLTNRPRQNIIYEAGMAMIIHPRRTVLVELGRLRLPSDLDGMHTVRLNNSKGKRRELADKLIMAGCIVDLTGEEWHDAGDFNEALTFEARVRDPTLEDLELDLDSKSVEDMDTKVAMIELLQALYFFPEHWETYRELIRTLRLSSPKNGEIIWCSDQIKTAISKAEILNLEKINELIPQIRNISINMALLGENVLKRFPNGLSGKWVDTDPNIVVNILMGGDSLSNELKKIIPLVKQAFKNTN